MVEEIGVRKREWSRTGKSKRKRVREIRISGRRKIKIGKRKGEGTKGREDETKREGEKLR